MVFRKYRETNDRYIYDGHYTQCRKNRNIKFARNHRIEYRWSSTFFIQRPIFFFFLLYNFRDPSKRFISRGNEKKKNESKIAVRSR